MFVPLLSTSISRRIMPELPEVETTRRGLLPHLKGRRLVAVTVHHRGLRTPVRDDFETRLKNARVNDIERRGKYLLIKLHADRTLLVHLGMSGSLRITDADSPRRLHDHIEWRLDSGHCLRYNDPRRFGLAELIDGDVAAHPRLSVLGPEPLSAAFNASALYERTRGHRVCIKVFIMNGHHVVGVGNIYASESLHLAHIAPKRRASSLSLEECAALVAAIKAVLKRAIQSGGTTLRNYLNPAGDPGYFRQKLLVYEREGQACYTCDAPIKSAVLGQRSTYWCPHCQPSSTRQARQRA